MTGVDGQITCPLLGSVGHGSLFSKDQAMILGLLGTRPAMGVLDGVLYGAVTLYPSSPERCHCNKEEVAFKALDVTVHAREGRHGEKRPAESKWKIYSIFCATALKHFCLFYF